MEHLSFWRGFNGQSARRWEGMQREGRRLGVDKGRGNYLQREKEIREDGSGGYWTGLREVIAGRGKTEAEEKDER